MVRNKRRPEYKQMTLETAIRNPERYKDILSFMKDYDGVILNDENLLDIITNMYEKGLVTSKDFDINSYDTRKKKEDSVKRINSTRRADGGFPQGYQSRFWTYMRTPSELGFVYAQYNEKFIMGDVAKKLVDDIIDSQEAFSLQIIKYNRKSPYRNVSNDFNFFKFIIRVLLELKKESKKLSYNQFVVSLFSKDGNVKDFLDIIKNNEFLNDIDTFNFVKGNFPKVNRFQTTIIDYPDVVLRMLRITGLVNVEYKGTLLISLNEENIDYLKELLSLDFDLSMNEKINAKEYFNKLEKIKENELLIVNSNRITNIKISTGNEVLEKIISKYDLTLDKVVSILEKVCTKSKKKNIDDSFKYISDPLKFEFFISILMYILYGNEFDIKPNYKTDAYGMPISHAPGNIGDIEIIGDKVYWLIEVTLIRNKAQQLNNETVNLFRHTKAKINDDKYLSLIAPYIHPDTEMLYNSATVIKTFNNGICNFWAKPYDIKEFIEVSCKKNNFNDMKDHTNSIIQKVYTELGKYLKQ